MQEVLWFGRGGQGVVVAAQMLAEAAYFEGFQGVTATPTFGPERRGAPLTALTRIAAQPIRTFGQVDTADILVVLDESLFGVVDILGRAKPGALMVVNTPRSLESFSPQGSCRVAVVDAVSVAFQNHLIKEGAPLVNTPMMGAFAKASGLVSLDNIERALASKLAKAQVAKNAATARAAFDQTVVAPPTASP